MLNIYFKELQLLRKSRELGIQKWLSNKVSKYAKASQNKIRIFTQIKKTWFYNCLFHLDSYLIGWFQSSLKLMPTNQCKDQLYRRLKTWTWHKCHKAFTKPVLISCILVEVVCNKVSYCYYYCVAYSSYIFTNRSLNSIQKTFSSLCQVQVKSLINFFTLVTNYLLFRGRKKKSLFPFTLEMKKKYI